MMKELLSITSVMLVIGTTDSPNANAWLMLAAVLAIANLAAWRWEAINRGIERAVRWFWAASVAPVVGISTRSVDEIVRDYEREPKAARTRLHYKRKNVR